MIEVELVLVEVEATVPLAGPLATVPGLASVLTGIQMNDDGWSMLPAGNEASSLRYPWSAETLS